MGQSPEDEDWANDDIEKVETKVNTTPVNRRDIRNDIRNKDIQDFSGQKEQPKKDIKETKEVKEKSLKEIYDVESLKEKIKEDDYLYRECYWGAFSRSIILPVEVRAEKINAFLENGVLTIILPKSKTSKQISIKVKEK